MGLKEISEWMAGEFAVIAGAPVTFIAAVLAASILIWKAMSWRYSGIIERLRADVEHLARAAAQPQGISPTPPEPASGTKTRVTGEAEGLPQIKRFKPRAAVPKDDILPATITPAFLAEIRRDLTGAQADKVVLAYVGKWMYLNGYVHLTGIDRGNFHVLIGPVKGDQLERYIESASLWFEGEPPEGAGLRQGDVIAALGRIQSIGNMGLILTQCEIGSVSN